MEGRILLKNCAVLRADGRVRRDMAVVVDGDRIREVRPDAEVPVRPGDWEVACRGRLLSPGLIDCHAHLANGATTACTAEEWLRSPKDRFEVQQALDAKQTRGTVGAIAADAIAQALRRGVTSVVEHTHAPLDPTGGLEAVAEAAGRLGLRLVASHASSSADGEGRALEAVDINAGFARAHARHPLVRGALGLHASFTCSEALLARAAKAREAADGRLVFHCAESELDLAETYNAHSERIVARFERHGLLGPGVVAALARAVDRGEADKLSLSRTLVAISPVHELLAEPGGGGFEATFSRENLHGIGSSGVDTLQAQLGAAVAGLTRIARSGRLLDPDNVVADLLFGGPSELFASAFGAPVGLIEPGALADLVVHDFVPPPSETPQRELLIGFSTPRVAWTIVNGRVCVREGVLLGTDSVELSTEAARAVASIQRR